MFIPLSTCASNGDAFFFGRDRREAPLPVGCSIVDIREVAEETGISVDEVISRLDDFAAADALLGFGFSMAAAEAAEEIVCAQSPVREPFFEVSGAFAPIPGDPLTEEAVIFETSVEPEPVFAEAQAEPPAREEAEAPVVEPETPPVGALQEEAPTEAAAPGEIVIEAEAVVVEEAYAPGEEADPAEEAAELAEAPARDAAIAAETVSAAWERRRARLRKRASVRGMKRQTEAGAEEKSGQKKEASSVLPVGTAKRPRLDIAKLRRMANVRVEAAEPEEDGEDDHLLNLNVPDGYVVQTSTESVVWPWEVQPDLTLKEALEAISDSLLAGLTEEVVNCTITGEMGEGGIKSLCEYYHKEKEQIYSAVQKESRRRITRMGAKAPCLSAMASDATQEMAMRMAKQFLQNEMGRKAMCFKSPYPDENGIYHIIQSHRVEDEDSVEFPNERIFYREMGNGWAISVGY